MALASSAGSHAGALTSAVNAEASSTRTKSLLFVITAQVGQKQMRSQHKISYGVASDYHF
jgi:hypothetical protein